MLWNMKQVHVFTYITAAEKNPFPHQPLSFLNKVIRLKNAKYHGKLYLVLLRSTHTEDSARNCEINGSSQKNSPANNDIKKKGKTFM